MSYILDALRKAERDRHLGRTPSLEEVTQTPARRAHRGIAPRPLILLGLVLGLAVLTAMFWPRAPHTDAGAAPTGAAAPPRIAAMAPAAVPPVVSPQATAVEAAASPAALDASVPAESMDDLVDEPAPVVARISADTEPGDASTRPLEDQAATDDGTADETAEEPEPKLQPPSATAVGITSLRDMPDAYRADFPELRVDVHVYDEDPARRWTMIDGNKYVEGATLPQGPRIVAITVDGLVLDYRGQTVLFPLRR